MKEPDWVALDAIGAELTAAIDSGGLDKDLWLRLWERAVEAVNGHNDFLEFLVNKADPDWLEA